MTEYVASRSELQEPYVGAKQRVDPAHDLLRGDADPTPWMALAGRDPAQDDQHLDRQTNELLAYIQNQNQEVDQRQSELNAKLAQLDNLLRVARLQKGTDAGHDLLGESSLRESSPPESSHREQDKTASRLQTTSPLRETSAITSVSPRLPEFEDVEKVVAEIADLAEFGGHADSRTLPPSRDERNNEHNVEDSFSLLFGRSENALPLRTTNPIDSLANSLEADSIQSEKRLLAERKLELDRRKAVLQRMQDEAQSLHREALETRLITEQLWAQLTERVPADKLNHLFASLRERLHEQYASAERVLAERKSELEVLRSKLQQKQHELREQSQKLQSWVESRHDEIKQHAAQLDAREVLLDRREHRLQDEFARWEAQRRSYKEQLSSVLQKINLTPHA